jgi:quinol-cytochrome oxidoreductase complex cytochrome b subunit
MSLIDSIVRRFGEFWEDMLDRLRLREFLDHPVPRYSNINPLWWTGDISVVSFFILAATGMILALYYQPGIDTMSFTLPNGEVIQGTAAFVSTANIYYNVPFGFLLLNIHLWTAYIMVFTVLMHFLTKLIMGSYKGVKGKSSMWYIGVVLGSVVIGQAVLGYILPLGLDSILALQIGINIWRYFQLEGIPISSLVLWFFGSSFVTNDVMLKVFILHILILPAVILVLIFMKINILLYTGPSMPPTGGASRAQVEKLWSIVEPFYPHRFILTMGQVFLQLGFIFLLASVFPFPLYYPGMEYNAWILGQPVPSGVRAPWPVSWYYYLVKAINPFISAWIPIVMIVFALLIPLLDRGNDVRIERRWIWILVALIYFLILAYGTYLGYVVEQPQPIGTFTKIVVPPNQLTPIANVTG